ncbi:MAG: SUMF1/EgtB/PvdO family nonheme iron enzyme [Myxococcales bacterium]|nr:SUMF1/EgtB/PvdO family nonheme iron enzyme [Myxococcales bacterium]
MFSHADLAEGTLFAAEFRVVRRLASGGMGAVYLAEQLSTGRPRALKLMHFGMASSPELREKFALEARVGARIASEHVVEVVGAGVDAATGTPWLAMELLVGDDLSATVRSHGPFTLAESAAILGQVCHALGAAHAAGIVHRDLKPANVFLAHSKRAQEAYTVKVLDFGIAKLLEEARANTGAIGSPLWMAPEQTERSADISPATDVWALGLLAFHMLTGHEFWLAARGDGGAGEGGRVRGFFRELVLEPIPPASQRARELGAPTTLPGSFDTWFARAVAREPRDRYGDATEAYAALCALCGFVPPATSVPPRRPSLPDSRPRTDPNGIVTPLSATANARLGDAATVATGAPAAPLRASLAVTPSDAVADSDEPAAEPAPLPVSGPSPRVLAAGALVLAALGGVAVLLRPRGPAGEPEDAAVTPGALPYCPKGMVRVAATVGFVGADGGPREEQPAHTEQVNAFCMDMTEVTVAEYAECVKRGGCRAGHKDAAWPTATKEERVAWSRFCNEGRDGTAEHPMNCVSFDDAAAYCRWANKALPTEAQWEIVARGPEARPFPWGHDAPTPLRVNACDKGCGIPSRRSVDTVAALVDGDDRWEGTSPVGAFPAGVSPFGAFDMAGNVAEWVDAPFCPYGETACGTVARVVRGGSWSSVTPASLRATARAKAAPDNRQPDVGFRCAK